MLCYQRRSLCLHQVPALFCRHHIPAYTRRQADANRRRWSQSLHYLPSLDSPAQGTATGASAADGQGSAGEVVRVIPIHQTIFGNKRGNCLQACVASILELDLDKVPNFVEAQDGEWWNALTDFCLGRGIQPIILDANPQLEDNATPWKPKGLCILSGKSPRGDFLHATIYHGSKMVHDPHPDGTGVMSEVDWILFIPLNPVERINSHSHSITITPIEHVILPDPDHDHSNFIK